MLSTRRFVSTARAPGALTVAAVVLWIAPAAIASPDPAPAPDHDTATADRDPAATDAPTTTVDAGSPAADAGSPAADAGPVASVAAPRPPGEAVTPADPSAGPARELTAKDVAGAPLPGYEHGRIDPIDDGDTRLRKFGRAMLFLPRYALDLALTPIRGGLWASERYQLAERYRRVFYNDAQTIGLYPTASVDTSLGFTVGAAFVDKDLFGAKEQVRLQAVAGSRYRQIYSASFSSGDRLGDRFSLELDAGYERRPHDAFYGIGNGDEVAKPEVPIDPRVDSSSFEARYRQDRARVLVAADVRILDQLHIRPAGSLADVEFGNGDEGPAIGTVYDRQGLVGFEGIRYSYAELELRWDSRRRSSVYEPLSVYSTGGLVSVFGGRVNRIDHGRDFWRYGADLQRFFRLARGPRVIFAHLHGEAVTGRRDEVPFTELPRLGGPTYLRGYDLDQFRDRVAAFGTLAYQWDLSQWVSASLFTDVGRVFPSMHELSADHLRVGYGAAIEGHNVDSFLLALSIASSIDGGLFFNLSFNPIYDLDQRVRRR